MYLLDSLKINLTISDFDANKDEPPVSKDVKDRLADLKSEFKKTKKRTAELGVRDKKR